MAVALALTCAGLLLLSLVQVLLAAGTGPGIVPAQRWTTVLGVVLTAGLAALLLLGAVCLLHRHGRTLLLAGTWLEVGVAVVTLLWWLSEGRRVEEASAVAAGVGLLLALLLALVQVAAVHHRSVGRWSAGAAQPHRVLPAGRTGGRVLVAVLTPVAALALTTVAVVAAAGEPVADGVRATGVGVGSPVGPVGRPTAPPGPGPDWSAEFAPFEQACLAGAMDACDDLYWGSVVGDVHEDYGSTCGGRLTGRVEGGCAALLGHRVN